MSTIEIKKELHQIIDSSDANFVKDFYEIIKDFMNEKYTDNEFLEKKEMYTHNQPYDKESLFYREIFEKYYPNKADLIPYFWRHPFSTQLDPSARLLESY